MRVKGISDNMTTFKIFFFRKCKDLLIYFIPQFDLNKLNSSSFYVTQFDDRLLKIVKGHSDGGWCIGASDGGWCIGARLSMKILI